MAKQSTLAFLLPILLVCAAVLAAYSFLPESGGAAQQAGGEISLSIEGRPLVSGGSATLRAVSTCGAFDVSLDGAEFGSGSPLLSEPFLLQEGIHSFSAQGKGCNSTLEFTVLARECEGNEALPCAAGGCPGARKCLGGVFSECLLPKKVCSPGEKVGCSTNGCSFGYMVCNQCGTSFGKCLPPGAANSACGTSSCG